jgi:hypothetical protein
MTKKSQHFLDAVDRLHHQEVLEAVQETLVATAIDPENASLELEETEERLVIEEVVEEEDCFCAGGGCVCEEMPKNWRTTKDFDEEDRRFGEFPINRFQTALQQVFGGPLKETLACNRRIV